VDIAFEELVERAERESERGAARPMTSYEKSAHTYFDPYLSVNMDK
jgi:hypothetical protein